MPAKDASQFDSYATFWPTADVAPDGASFALPASADTTGGDAYAAFLACVDE